MRKAGLWLNMEKTDWVKTQVKFLGHLISDQGVTVPPELSQIIKDWPLPKTLKDLQFSSGSVIITAVTLRTLLLLLLH